MNGHHLMVEKNILLEKTENEMKCKDKNEINKRKRMKFYVCCH